MPLPHLAATGLFIVSLFVGASCGGAEVAIVQRQEPAAYEAPTGKMEISGIRLGMTPQEVRDRIQSFPEGRMKVESGTLTDGTNTTVPYTQTISFHPTRDEYVNVGFAAVTSGNRVVDIYKTSFLDRPLTPYTSELVAELDGLLGAHYGPPISTKNDGYSLSWGFDEHQQRRCDPGYCGLSVSYKTLDSIDFLTQLYLRNIRSAYSIHIGLLMQHPDTAGALTEHLSDWGTLYLSLTEAKRQLEAVH